MYIIMYINVFILCLLDIINKFIPNKINKLCYSVSLVFIPDTKQSVIQMTAPFGIHLPVSSKGFDKVSRIVRKPDFCLCENKAADQLRGSQISFAVTAKLISAFVFATRIVQFLFFLNPKFQASSLLL